jgi:hypothetical protein
MKYRFTHLVLVCSVLSAVSPLLGQGYIVPNGVVTNLFPGEFTVRQDPDGFNVTGFFLDPRSMTPPTSYTNTFRFIPVVDEGVRVFLVSANDEISLQPILAGNYTELTYPNTYVFPHNQPFYVGLYTGNQYFAPPDGIYSDPLFGWARLVNNRGVIEFLDSALVYQAGGIYAGTFNIIPVPEPAAASLVLFGLFSLRFCRRRHSLV